MTRAARVWVFAGVCAIAAASIGLSLFKAIGHASVDKAIPMLAAPPARPYLMFASLISDRTWGRIALAPLDAPNGARYVTSLKCDRLYYRGDRGLCLITEQGFPSTFAAFIFDDHFNQLHRIPLTGPPSRTRISPDGRVGVVTVFEAGHSYMDTGFSTRTTLIDMTEGRVIANLETFVVTRDGKRFRAADFNFWGVTFAQDSNTFYATLGTGNEQLLIEGRVDTREARVLTSGVECPSLSPDNTRLVFKKRVTTGRGRSWDTWQLWVMDLASQSQRPVKGATTSVDDQVEWLDQTHVLYFLPSEAGNNIVVLDVDADAAPRIFVSTAASPSVIR